jgi:hypothetical protein
LAQWGALPCAVSRLRRTWGLLSAWVERVGWMRERRAQLRYALVYLLVGIIWSSGVGLVRLWMGSEYFGPALHALAWLPMTALLWPWSMSISFRDIYWSARGEEPTPAEYLTVTQLFVIAALTSAVFGLVRHCS